MEEANLAENCNHIHGAKKLTFRIYIYSTYRNRECCGQVGFVPYDLEEGRGCATCITYMHALLVKQASLENLL